MNILHSLEMSGYVKLTSTQCNIPEDQNPQQHCCGNLRSDIHFLLDFYRNNYFKILHPTLTMLQIQKHNIISALLISSMSIEFNLLLTELFCWMYAFQSWKLRENIKYKHELCQCSPSGFCSWCQHVESTFAIMRCRAKKVSHRFNKNYACHV